MTARGYPDCDATSPNGRYRLEARSPHNGTVPHRNGQFATEAEYGFAYRDHQSHFRYQLLDTATGNEVVWERWQAQTEDSPDEVVVSDDGWSILRVCGYRPEVIAVTPTGRDALRVVVADADQTEQEALAGIVNRGPNARRWCPNTLSFTTAGSFWTGNSWRYFVTALDTRYFVWRSARGARLIIDLDGEELVTEDEARDTGLEPHFVERESADALQMLSKFAQQLDAIRTALASDSADKWRQEPLKGIWGNSSGLVLAAAHKLTSAVPYLRALEPLACDEYSTSSRAFADRHSLDAQWPRRLVQHALRAVDEEPMGYAAFYFEGDDSKRLTVPECVANRHERAKQLTRNLSALDVLQLLGAPDFVSRYSRSVGTQFEWAEHWEYDFRTAAGWMTLRIGWGDGADRGRILAITEGPAAWLESDERANELFRY